MKPACTKCNKIPKGKLKVLSYRKILGKKAINVVEYYCDKCFSIIEKERSIKERKKKEIVLRKHAVRRIRRRKK